VRAIVSLNAATAEELAQLPGIGPVRAEAIVADRRRHGPFRRIEDLERVPGIGSATVERLRERLRVP
jgi:competence protein ComEA